MDKMVKGSLVRTQNRDKIAALYCFLEEIGHRLLNFSMEKYFHYCKWAMMYKVYGNLTQHV